METTIDEKEYPKRALKQIRALANGNGVTPGAIQISKMQGEIVHCEAITHLELHPEVTTERKNGRHQAGQLLENPAMIDKAVEKHLADLNKNSELRKFMCDLLLSRPDKGFSMHAEYFDIPPANKTFSFHEPCGTCQGNAQTVCSRCNGQRREVCNNCHARGMMPCTYCHSSGYMQGPDGNQRQCTYCHGQRQIICNVCQKRGSITCRQCKGVGKIKCGPCKGEGFFTQITHIIGKMKTLFEIDRASLPHPAVKAIENQGSKMVEQKHIACSGEQVKREDGGLAIQYKTEFPYADLILSVNGKPVKISIFGYKGKLAKVPNFLEDIAAPQLVLLEEAARGKNNIVPNIRKASQARLVAESLKLSLALPRKKALIGLKKKFPYGIRNDRLKEMVTFSKKSLANLTAKARYGGFALAALFNAGMNWFYFTSDGLRGMIAASAGQNALMVVDIALIPVGGFIGSLVTGYMAKRPLKKALGHFMQKISANKLVVWPNYAISAGVFVAVLLVLHLTGETTPDWLPF